MLSNSTTHLLLGASLVLVNTFYRELPDAPPTIKAIAAVSSEEILSYECARTVGSMVALFDQPGPLYSSGQLVFTSVESTGDHPILVVSAGSGIYSLPLFSAGVNRIRFQLNSQNYFLSYLHGSNGRSRIFDFGVGRPAGGREDLDYVDTEAQRAEHLLEHLDYAVYRTVEGTLNSLTDGRLDRYQVDPERITDCEHLERSSPQLARNLRRSLDVVEMIVTGPKQVSTTGSRMPASINN